MEGFFLFKIGFLDFRFLDFLDVVIVGFFLFQVYKLLRGSIALSIFLGLTLVYLVWFVVRLLDMKLTAGILGQFIEVGVILLLIVFQPEVRRFLLYLGRTGLSKQFRFLQGMMKRGYLNVNERDQIISEIVSCLQILAHTKTGAILVFGQSSNLDYYAGTGVLINGKVSGKLLESIFEKRSPMHDGAVLIQEGKLLAAGCVLPVSENADLPSRTGMRHKAAVGITESTDAVVLVVSEQTGAISYAREGRLQTEITLDDVEKVLKQLFPVDPASKLTN